MHVLDPVHGSIAIRAEEQAIIDTPIFQRLRHIKQLTSAELVFPGCEHTRFAHSLGAMHIAGKYAEHVFAPFSQKEYLVRLTRLAALLHDICHGAFSHAYDATIYAHIYPGVEKGHDVHRQHIITDPMLRPLIEKSINSVDDILDVWTDEPHGNNTYFATIIHALVQGCFGADRLDYLSRDAFYSGIACYVPIDRFVQHARVIEKRLCYDEKIQDEMHYFYIGRQFMYNKLYHHPTIDASKMLIQKMLEHAMVPLNLIEKTKSIHEFVYLTDDTLKGVILSNVDTFPQSAVYLIKLYHRQLPKLVEEVRFEKKEEAILYEKLHLSDPYACIIFTLDFSIRSEMQHYDIRLYNNKTGMTHVLLDDPLPPVERPYIVRIYKME